MSYTALYRKFRPAEFSEVKGQDVVVKTLQNQIKSDRIGHAYLFTGTRGTGKTTIAKIMAKAVNCENLVDGNPCNECETCKSINAGASINVRELDAASNNGVDSIRQIIEEIEYPPTEGRFKVYIIDEVHMLSTGAFNALLKTLEEPPSYVIFILATTEVGKIPVTILSRCQRYDFKRISIDTIADRLRELCEREQIIADDKAIMYIAKAADGSMRDALSLLDRCNAFYLDEELSFDNVLKCLGAVDTEVFSRLLRYILNRDVNGAINTLDEVITGGKEIRQFVADFMGYLRNIMLLKSSSDMADVIEVSSENLKLIQEEAKIITEDEVIRYIRILSELDNQIRYASNKRVLVEIAIIKLCRPAIEPDVSEIMGRLEKLESQVEKGITVSINNANASSSSGASNATNEKLVEKVVPKALPEDIKKVVASWKSIVDAIPSKPLKSMMLNTKLNITEENGNLVIAYDERKADSNESGVIKFLLAEDEEINKLKLLEDTIENSVGKHVNIIIKNVNNTDTGHVLDPRAEFKSNVIDNLNFQMSVE